MKIIRMMIGLGIGALVLSGCGSSGSPKAKDDDKKDDGQQVAMTEARDIIGNTGRLDCVPSSMNPGKYASVNVSFRKNNILEKSAVLYKTKECKNEDEIRRAFYEGTYQFGNNLPDGSLEMDFKFKGDTAYSAVKLVDHKLYFASAKGENDGKTSEHRAIDFSNKTYGYRKLIFGDSAKIYEDRVIGDWATSCWRKSGESYYRQTTLHFYINYSYRGTYTRYDDKQCTSKQGDPQIFKGTYRVNKTGSDSTGATAGYFDFKPKDANNSYYSMIRFSENNHLHIAHNCDDNDGSSESKRRDCFEMNNYGFARRP